MNLHKRKVLMKAFLASQFSYYPLAWMIHNRTLNNCINILRKRALRLTYKENQSSFKELLEKDHSVTIHNKNLQVLVTEIFKVKNDFTEIFKVKNDLAPDIMNDVFKNPHTTYGQNQITLYAEMLRLLIMVSYQLSA